MIATLLLMNSPTNAIPACEGIELAELKKKFLSEVHNEHDYKAFKPYKWKICARTLGTTLYKAEKDKADKVKEEQAEAAKDNEGEDKPDENKEGADKENGNKTDENKKDKKLSIIETDIANHYLHRIYPNYPLP